jgi:hypothetical protein
MALRKKEYLKKEYLLDPSVDVTATGAGIFTLRACDPNGNALPEGFVVSKVSAIVETALTVTGGSVTFGTETDPDGFLADFRAAYAAVNSVVRNGEVAGALLWDDTNDHEIDYRVNATAANGVVVCELGTNGLTTGKIRFVVEGYMVSDAAGYAN